MPHTLLGELTILLYPLAELMEDDKATQVGELNLAPSVSDKF